ARRFALFFVFRRACYRVRFFVWVQFSLCPLRLPRPGLIFVLFSFSPLCFDKAEAKLERRSRGGDSPCPWRFRELPALELHFCPLSIRSPVSWLVIPLCRSVEYDVLLVFVPYLGQFMSPSRLLMQPLVGVISRFCGCCGRLWWAAVVVCRCSGVSPCFCRCSVGVSIDVSVACGISLAYVLLMCLYARIM
uniref:Uncharacterized protein n=2 Tax=Aegilops tauschii subsp. strangulata TaxID=200361 RepID=A0A453PXN8_AEGTS